MLDLTGSVNHFSRNFRITACRIVKPYRTLLCASCKHRRDNTRAALPFTDGELTATEVSKDIIALFREGDFVHSVPEVAVF